MTEARQLTAADILLGDTETEDYTFVFVAYRNETWARDCLHMTDCLNPNMAARTFWQDHDENFVLLAPILMGRLKTVDEFEFGDEPNVSSEDELEQLIGRLEDDLGGTQDLRHYSVLSVRDTGEGFVRTLNHVQAHTPTHAELIARRGTIERGEHLMCAVFDNWIPRADDAERFRFASPDGQPLPAWSA